MDASNHVIAFYQEMIKTQRSQIKALKHEIEAHRNKFEVQMKQYEKQSTAIYELKDQLSKERAEVWRLESKLCEGEEKRMASSSKSDCGSELSFQETEMSEWGLFESGMVNEEVRLGDEWEFMTPGSSDDEWSIIMTLGSSDDEEEVDIEDMADEHEMSLLYWIGATHPLQPAWRAPGVLPFPFPRANLMYLYDTMESAIMSMNTSEREVSEVKQLSAEEWIEVEDNTIKAKAVNTARLEAMQLRETHWKPTGETILNTITLTLLNFNTLRFGTVYLVRRQLGTLSEDPWALTKFCTFAFLLGGLAIDMACSRNKTLVIGDGEGRGQTTGKLQAKSSIKTTVNAKFVPDLEPPGPKVCRSLILPLGAIPEGQRLHLAEMLQRLRDASDAKKEL